MALVLGAALATACSSFSSEATPPSPAPVDASDASSDAAVVNEPPPGADAATADAGLCNDPAAHDLCEDFDHGSLAADDWESGMQSSADGGVAEIDSVQFTSAPSSLLITNSTVGFKVQRSYFLHRNLTKTASKKVVVAFDLYVDTLTNAGGPSADTLVVILGDGAYSNQIRVANLAQLLNVDVVESIPALGAAGYFVDRYTFGGSSFAVQRWHRFVLTADREKNELALSIDGVSGMRPPMSTPHVPSGQSSTFGLDLGSQADTHEETMKLYYDNVTVDLDR